jgi:hypothetical protein
VGGDPLALPLLHDEQPMIGRMQELDSMLHQEASLLPWGGSFLLRRDRRDLRILKQRGDGGLLGIGETAGLSK